MYLHPTKGYRGKNTIQTKSNRRRKYIVCKVKYENKLKKENRKFLHSSSLTLIFKRIEQQYQLLENRK